MTDIDSSPRLRAVGRVLSWVLVTSAIPGGALAEAPAPSSAPRWTATTPDEMVDALFARVHRGGDDALAALLVAQELDDRASFGKVRDGLLAIANSPSALADEARWLRQKLLPAHAGPVWRGFAEATKDAPPDAGGLVKNLAILGPFQDTGGGGLMRRDGPEAPGDSWSNMDARYAWGAFDVAWRRVLPSSVTARGVPLDLYIHPRSESCTILASKITVPQGPKPMTVRVASSGAVRLVWDQASIAASEEVHPRLVLDRIAARIEPTPGDHLLAVKVCSAATGDEGRVRLRFTDDKQRPLAIKTSSDLRGLTLRAAPVASAPGGDPYGDEAPASKKAAKKAAPKIAAKPGKKPAGKGKPAPLPSPSKIAIAAPVGITILPSTIQKALDIGESPSTDRALVAAIVRIHGGVDDARSPRAPGLLDRVARAADVTPDQLAMAGWISPFGANRSGWLNLARSRADAARDAATVAFAQRRLVAAHMTSRYYDWALSTAGEEPFKSSNDSEALLIRALLKKNLGSTGFGRSALDDMYAIEAAHKDRTPLAALAESLPLSRTQAAAHLRIAKRLAHTEADARGSAYVASFRLQGAEAIERAAAQTLAQQTRIGDVLHIGRMLLDDGRYAWAREVFYTATQLAPNRAAGFIGLAAAREGVAAEEARAGKPPSESPAILKATLQRARDLEPSEASLKAEMALRSSSKQGATGAHASGMRDEAYIEKPEVFLARGRAVPAKKGEIVDRQLHWVRVVTYHPDKRVSQLMQYSREIFIEPRTENDLYEGLPQEGDDTEILFARVHRKDGTVALPDETMSGGRKPYIRWPELKTGDVVEVCVRSWTAGPVGRRGDAPFWFIDYVGSTDTHPILYNEVVIDSPEGSPLAIDVLHGKEDRRVRTVKDGRVVTRYVWDKPPSIQDEPLAPKLSESLPVVVGSTFASWGDFREWYRAAVKGFTEPDDQVRRIAADLVKGKKTRDEKLKAIFEFVADDIRYVNYVSGEWWLPNRPQQLLARRQGDCDDKAMLLITLLKAIGIEAHEVLIQTRYTAQPSLLRGEKAAIPLFDHGIAYLPGEKGKPGIWLDATSPESRLGPLPSMDARTVAFFIDEGQAKIIDTPASSPDEHGVDASWTITLSPSGAGDLVAEERHSGDAAFELRMNLKQPDARAQWVEQYLASGWFPTVQVTGAIGFSPDLPKGIAILKYGAHSEGLARREGTELAVPLAESSTITSQLAPLVKRTLPVVLPPRLAPGHETRTITIVAPAGYAFAELPPNGEVQGGEFGKARIEFKRAGGKNAVVVKRSLVFDLDHIPVEKYAKWRAWLQRVDGLMHRTVRLVESGKAAPAVPGKVARGPKKGR